MSEDHKHKTYHRIRKICHKVFFWVNTKFINLWLNHKIVTIVLKLEDEHAYGWTRDSVARTKGLEEKV